MDASNHSQMTTALQVFHNLDTLKEEASRALPLQCWARATCFFLTACPSPLQVDDILQSRKDALVKELRAAFAQTPEEARKSAGGGSASAESGRRLDLHPQ